MGIYTLTHTHTMKHSSKIKNYVSTIYSNVDKLREYYIQINMSEIFVRLYVRRHVCDITYMQNLKNNTKYMQNRNILTDGEIKPMEKSNQMEREEVRRQIKGVGLRYTNSYV